MNGNISPRVSLSVPSAQAKAKELVVANGLPQALKIANHGVNHTRGVAGYESVFNYWSHVKGLLSKAGK